MLGQARYYRSLVLDFTAHRHLLFMCASFSLLVGILLVLLHNVWQPPYARILVTILAWWIVIKSILWLGAPETMARCASKCYSGAGYYVAAAVTFIYGMLLMAFGFFYESSLFNGIPFVTE